MVRYALGAVTADTVSVTDIQRTICVYDPHIGLISNKMIGIGRVGDIGKDPGAGRGNADLCIFRSFTLTVLPEVM